MNSFAEILLIAIFMSAACALPGNFLVLRRMSMLTDAIPSSSASYSLSLPSAAWTRPSSLSARPSWVSLQCG